MQKARQKKTKIWKRLRLAYALLVAVVCVFGMGVSCQDLQAYDEVEDIKVTVGYWGGKDYVKKEVSLSELESACGVHQQVYTWINAGEAPGTTEAEGVYISDIMDYCGVNRSSVYYYNFYTVDAAT